MKVPIIATRNDCRRKSSHFPEILGVDASDMVSSPNQSRNYGAGGCVHPLEVCGEYLIFFIYPTQYSQEEMEGWGEGSARPA